MFEADDLAGDAKDFTEPRFENGLRQVRAHDDRTGVGSDMEEAVRRLQRLATTMDSAFRIPIINRRIGFDSLIGLIPGLGDIATTTVSALIVHKSMKLGIRKRTVVKMLGNIALDALLGSVPLLGDIFDFAFKANMKNVALLQQDLRTHDADGNRTAAKRDETKSLR